MDLNVPNDQRISKTSMKMHDHCSFIIVKHGENNEQLFNPWCPSGVLLECIRRKCNCDEEETIDLIDMQGQLKNLPDKTGDYANMLLDSRQTYVLIKIERQDGELPPKYISLLHNIWETHPDLNERLNILSKAPSPKPDGLPKKSKWNTMKTKINVTRSLMSISKEKAAQRNSRPSISS